MRSLLVCRVCGEPAPVEGSLDAVEVIARCACGYVTIAEKDFTVPLRAGLEECIGERLAVELTPDCDQPATMSGVLKAACERLLDGAVRLVRQDRAGAQHGLLRILMKGAQESAQFRPGESDNKLDRMTSARVATLLFVLIEQEGGLDLAVAREGQRSVDTFLPGFWLLASTLYTLHHIWVMAQQELVKLSLRNGAMQLHKTQNHTR
ncbi:MAG TPA: hypothetical protein VIG99_08965, partial [Myxococcaceae bacterium]